jgi:hypothetical protein
MSGRIELVPLAEAAAACDGDVCEIPPVAATPTAAGDATPDR